MEVVSRAQAKRVLLSEIPSAMRGEVLRIVQEDYPDVLDFDARVDPWPMVVDERGTYRWKKDPLIDAITNPSYIVDPSAGPAEFRKANDSWPLCLNRLALAHMRGTVSSKIYLELLKRMGYSLQGYYECLVHRNWYRAMWREVVGRPWDDVDEMLL